jgi:quinol monooxygenase YgiN
MNYGKDHVNHTPGTKSAEMRRRRFLARIATMATVVGTGAWAAPQPKEEMYGEIGKIVAVSGKREEVMASIMEGIRNMPGCLSYIVAKDASNADAIWISEVWDSKASHDQSLSLPFVKVAIAKNRPLIAGFGDSMVLVQIRRIEHREAKVVRLTPNVGAPESEGSDDYKAKEM